MARYRFFEVSLLITVKKQKAMWERRSPSCKGFRLGCFPYFSKKSQRELYPCHYQCSRQTKKRFTIRPHTYNQMLSQGFIQDSHKNDELFRSEDPRQRMLKGFRFLNILKGFGHLIKDSWDWFLRPQSLLKGHGTTTNLPPLDITDEELESYGTF